MATTTLDVKGLNCPLPVLRANKVIKGLMAGDVLRVVVTDPAAPSDFAAYCETTGHELVDSVEADGVYTITIRRVG
ncbi:MAG: sulfurtransferase TusA family protein [Rhodospirillales bacterium]|jgi:tRNA 2-thiouridine synthesizing protein A|nr:sulfurtransferase TusA family protein [Rhodospirillales bacterium]